MSDRMVRRLVSAVFSIAALLTVAPSVGGATAPDDTIGTTATTDADATTVPAAPETTAPVDTTMPVDGGLVGVDETGSSDATAITWIGIVAAVGLIAVAAWWMLRRDASDELPQHPHDDWPTDSEVI